MFGNSVCGFSTLDFGVVSRLADPLQVSLELKKEAHLQNKMEILIVQTRKKRCVNQSLCVSDRNIDYVISGLIFSPDRNRLVHTVTYVYFNLNV